MLTLERLDNKNIKVVLISDVNHWLSDKVGPTKMSKSLYYMKDTAIKDIMKWTFEK